MYVLDPRWLERSMATLVTKGTPCQQHIAKKTGGGRGGYYTDMVGDEAASSVRGCTYAEQYQPGMNNSTCIRGIYVACT